MATGAEHYQEAEGLLNHLDEIPDPHGDGAHACDLLLAEAQVHATLANAAAIALTRVGPDGSVYQRDLSAWYRAAGTKPVKDTYADEGADQ
jgi:hypothetical protein